MRTAAVLAFPGISPFHLSVPLMVFGGVGVRSVEAAYRVVTVAEEPGAIRTAALVAPAAGTTWSNSRSETSQ